jgi:hypothetical protein
VDCHQSVADLSRQSVKSANMPFELLRARHAQRFLFARARCRDGYPEKMVRRIDAQ